MARPYKTRTMTVIFPIEDQDVKFKLSNRGLTVRVKFSRHTFTIPFPKLFNVAQNQFALHLRNQEAANADRREKLALAKEERAAELMERG